MNSGKLHLDWEQLAKDTVLIALSNQESASPSLVERLARETGDGHPQPRFAHVPLPIARLDTLAYWQCAEVLRKWRTQSSQVPVVAELLAELGLGAPERATPLLSALDKSTAGTPLSFELAAWMQTLRTQRSQLDLQSGQWLDDAAAGLVEWFGQAFLVSGDASLVLPEGSCLAQLRDNATSMGITAQQRLQICFARVQRAGVQTALPLLSVLEEYLAKMVGDYLGREQDFRGREASAWRAYLNLRQQAQTGRGGIESWDTALRALSTTCNFKLQAEIYRLVGKLTGELLVAVREYTAALSLTNTLLVHLQDWFEERCSVEPTFASPLKSYLVRQLDRANLDRCLESFLGCPISRWGDIGAAQSIGLRKHLLARVRSLCLEAYMEYCFAALRLDSSIFCSDTPLSSGPAIFLPEPLRVTLRVCEAEVRDTLGMLSRVTGTRLVADESVHGIITVDCRDLPFREALEALIDASELTCTQQGEAYFFSKPSMQSL